MSLNIAIFLIIGGGWLAGKLFSLIKLPSVLGMTFWGVVVSVFFKELIPETLWSISPFLKSLALIIILLRAGLGIKKKVLQKVGRTAVLMAFIPCLLEASGLTLLLFYFTGFDLLSSGITGALLSAVSPAVVVPSMLNLKDAGYGKKKEIPTLVLAGASLDDVFIITLFTILISFATGGGNSIGGSLISIPVSIAGGIILGVVTGLILSINFNKFHDRLKGTEKSLILLIVSLFLFEVGDHIQVAALLGVMAAGFIVLEKAEKAAHETASQLKNAWVFAEIVLFVLIGSSVDVEVALTTGFTAVFIILGGLFCRSLGVYIATIGSGLNIRERVFCIISYLPKATVQAALGAVALENHLPNGEEILAYAVLAIIITAPLGLIGINIFGPRLLTRD